MLKTGVNNDLQCCAINLQYFKYIEVMIAVSNARLFWDWGGEAIHIPWMQVDIDAKFHK